MFIPIGDSPNFKATPWVNYTLLAMNILVFIFLWPLQFQRADPADPAAEAYQRVVAAERGVRVQVSAYDAIVFRHGFKPRFPSPMNILTAMFLHGGWLHLLGNMLFLWIYGDNVEHRLGHLGYLIAYLGTGVAAALGDALLRPDSAIPSVGASGAISGVLGFYFIWFPRNRVRVWVFLFPLFADIVELPARLVLGFYLVIDNILPLLITGGASGVAYGAHLGGFIAAVGAAVLLDRYVLQRPEGPVRMPRPPAREAASAGDPVAGYRQALDRGDLGGALSLLMDIPRAQVRRDLAPEDTLRLAELLEEAHHPRAALAVYQRTLADHPVGNHRARAHIGAARVMMADLGMPTAAYQHLYAALEEDPTPRDEAEARHLLAQLRQSGSVPRRWM